MKRDAREISEENMFERGDAVKSKEVELKREREREN